MDKTFARMLSEKLPAYLQLLEKSMSPATMKDKRKVLTRFVSFVEEKGEADVFTEAFVDAFQKYYGRTNVKKAVRPFSRHLYRQGVIDTAMGHYHKKLPEPFSSYLVHMADIHPDNPWPHRIVLTALHEYLRERDIALGDVKIVEVDHFLAQTYGHLALETRNKYRSCLRGFLKQLFSEGVIRKDLAPLLKNGRMFERNLPPRCLLPHEIRQLFGGLGYDTERDLRANAMIYLAFTLGLRPKEISRIRLGDIGFAKGELSLPFRKNNRPAMYPLSQEALKALSAYVLYARPRGEQQTLFLHLTAEKPLSSNRVSKEMTACMRKAGVFSSAYALRHTYAQQLLEMGRSVYEIKEMMGHEVLKTTMRYLSIHTSLMRRVLFNETV